MKTPQEVLDYAHNAKLLPADGKVYGNGGWQYRHCPETLMQCEQVFVLGAGYLWRCLKTRGKWGRVHPVSGTING